MKTTNYKRTKRACYSAYFTMSSIFCLPPMLFMTFHEMYGISYTLLGTLVLINFCTQLSIDLIFTMFSKHFNIHKVVKRMPLITSVGLLIYALVPMLVPSLAYLGLAIGTVVFSVSAGLSEVLLSPVIAAIPSDNPQKDMSMLHSLYAFGLFTMILISTVFLKVFGNENWMYLTLLMAVFPVISAVRFMLSPMPPMEVSEETQGKTKNRKRTFAMALCVACIFCGSCAENTMTSWISSFMENALHIDKAVGDIAGMALFAILLGMARIGYAKYGKNIMRVLLMGMIAAVCCYLTIGLVNNVVIAFIACILTGFVTSMLWPGTLIMMEENVPGIGVAAYALMASSGDLGASVAPQLMGIIVDKVKVSSWAMEMSQTLQMTTDQLGLKVGMIVIAIFPMIGTLVVLYAMRYFRKTEHKR